MALLSYRSIRENGKGDFERARKRNSLLDQECQDCEDQDMFSLQQSPEPGRKSGKCTPDKKAQRGVGVVVRMKRFGKQATRKMKGAKRETKEELEEVCLITESPYRALKVAARGNLDEFVNVYTKRPGLLETKGTNGQRPLHVAAAKGHRDIVDFIIQQHGCIDAVDERGDTALHLAVRNNQHRVLETLLQAGADHSILNEENMAPIHLACDLNNIEALKVMLKDSTVDRNLGGELGMKPLHYCAAKDHAECAQILIENGAMPCGQCDMGNFPIHIAAKCAAANTLEVLIQQGIGHGYARETLLSFTDKENNMPLHAAVYGGNIKAVEVCLKAGAPVNTQQDDKSTPVHFAAAQGNLDMMKLMYTMQADNFQTALNTFDAMGMTPLHRAALFNHKAVVVYLLELGSNINCKDSMSSTPLLVAASKGSWTTVQVLITYGADLHVHDNNARNFLHLAIRFGGKLAEFFSKQTENGLGVDGGEVRTKHDVRCLLDEKDDFGCTPMHYASKEGHLQALEDLISFGAAPSVKNNEKQSPFHFAARYGRYNTCRRLLELSQGPNIINETDADGLSGLHIAAQNGHTKIIVMLLQKGAIVQKDNDDNTPLHHAASQGWTQCMRTLLGVHQNLLDVQNIHGETALHLAAQNGRVSAVSLLLTSGAAVVKDKSEKTFFDYVIDFKNFDVAIAVNKHDRWQEVLISHSTPYGCPFLGLIEHMPAVCEAVLDRCQTPSEHDKKSPDYHIEYNYRFLDCPIECAQEAKRKGEFQPMMTLNAMVRHGRVNCLSHPVCVSYLKLKWTTYGQWLYFLVLGLYVLFLASLTYFVVFHDSLRHYDSGSMNNATAAMLGGNQDGNYDMSLVSTLSLWVMAVFSGLNIVKEIFQMITQRMRYFMELQNAFEWTMYVTTLLFCVPFLLHYSLHWQWEAGALAVFLCWFNLLVVLQRFDFFGIYVVMFLEILRTLLQALCVFSVLIVAFGLSFYMLLNYEHTRAYSTPSLSLIRTTMMMLEVDYLASFNEPYTDDDDTTLHFGNLTLFMVVVFVLLMPILVMNLLIGLAVGDIESVQRNARLKRLAGQVELHSDMESKMPMFMLARFKSLTYMHYPNKCKNKIINFWSRMTDADREDSVAMAEDRNRQALLDELFKQKQKMKDLNSVVDKNNQLLRLIMQKMEIHTEDEDWDEGRSNMGTSMDSLQNVGGSPADSLSPCRRPASVRSAARRRLLNKSVAVTYMNPTMDKG